jgi:hypothetical protein
MYLKKAFVNSFNYRPASIPPKSKFNGFAGDPTITANVMAIPKTIPTITNRVFISKVTNA